VALGGRLHGVHARASKSSILLVCLATLWGGSRTARAEAPRVDVDTACTASYTNAQRLRLRSQLRLARRQLLACLHPSCSPVLRGDCSEWLGEVEALTPSIAITARNPAGNPTTSVRVSVDGEVVAETLPETPLGIDPGAHILRFELAGVPPIERQYVIHEAEKALPVVVLFPAERPAPVLPPPPSVVRRTRAATLAYALGIGGAVALAGGVTFEVLGLSRRLDLDACKGHCSPSQVDSARALVAVGDVASAVAVTALASAAYLAFVRRRPAPGGATRVELTPFAAGLSVRGTF
jgi:hypothetical protein